MPFRTQRLVNNFPTWTKARRDPSSFASRMFSVFADYYDFRDVELNKLKNEFDLLKPHQGIPWVWKFTLSETDQLPVVITGGGITTWTYPTTVSGVFSTGTKTLTRVENLEDLLWSAPEELTSEETISVSNFLIWDSAAPTVYNSMDIADRVQVIVENSTDYFRRTSLKNRRASGWHFVIIEGKDINGQDFIEYLPIRDDGIYFTRNIISEVTSVLTEGFDGTVQLYVQTAVTSSRFLLDRYQLGIADTVEGPLKLSWTATSELQYKVQRIKAGINYRTGSGLGVVDNDELIWEQTLRDSGGAAITGIVDFDFCPDTNRMYVVTSDGTLRVYEHGQTSFTPPIDESDLTTTTYVEVQPVKHWANLNETMTLFTFLLRPRFPILGVTIKRRDPSGNVEYLQSNLTWAAGVYEHLGKDFTKKLPEESWQDITFTSLFDEYGEFEFYTTARTTGGTSITCTKVMVDSLSPVLEVASIIAGTPTALWFSYDGKLCVADASSVEKFNIHSHVYLANGPTQEIYVRENYTSVEVTL